MAAENTDTGKGIISTTQGGNTVDHLSANYRSWLSKSTLPRALYKGTQGMKDASTAFLPKQALESATAYNARLSISTLLNAFRKTAAYLAGQVFQSDIVFSDEVSDDFIDMLSTVDTSGNDINVFAKRLFQDGLAKGCSLIMVDAPKAAGGKQPTKAEAKARGIRPYLKQVCPESVIGGIEDENGRLIQVRIQEKVSKADGEYGSKQVSRIRVLTIGGWEIHEEVEGGGYTQIEKGNFPLQVLNIVPFLPGEEYDQLFGETPLMDLAELNAHHWRSQSDQNNILHVARVPILFGRHIKIEKMPVGTSTLVTSSEKDSQLTYVEISGKSIEAGQKDLTETEAKMALWGLQQLIPRTGAQTATEKALASSESHSSLGTWATEFDTVLQMAFEIMATFTSSEFPKGGAQTNKEYSYSVFDGIEADVLYKGVELGIIPKELCFNELKKRGILEESATWADAVAMMENEARTTNTDLDNLGKNLFGEE